ncbi:MAG TPA: hypothetical protein VKF14_14470, partial [Candidatus Dormibacteraeota bacterium]|nr:hypothetical protein [Candidatus Dormibacteraeota bacterium]
TTEQWVTDPVEEFNLPGDRSATALPTSPAAAAGVPTLWSATPAPHDLPARTRELDPSHAGELWARARRASR